MNLPNAVQVVGLVWYEPEHFERAYALMVDRHLLPSTYASWQRQADETERKLRGQGHRVVRAYVDPATFPDWCAARGLVVDANARIQFANMVAKEAYDRGG